MKFIALLVLFFICSCGPGLEPELSAAANNGLHREGGYIISRAPVLMPGDLEAINFSVAAPIYYRIIDNFADRGPWIIFNKQNIKSLRLKSVQFAVKDGDGPTINSLSWSVETNYSKYFQTQVRSRKQWDARAPKSDLSCDGDKCKFAVHHSAGSAASSDQTVKGIQAFHMDDKKWSDVGYHFLIGVDGTCFEGRELPFQGAHVYGHNEKNIGLCFVGCFDTSQNNKVDTTDAMIAKMGELIGVLAAHYGIDISRETIKGHKEFANIASLCPGDLVMARIDEILAKAIITKNQILF